MDSMIQLALTFIAKIRFRVSNEVYRAFLQGFGKLRQGVWGLDELDRETTLLLQDHSDLIDEFRRFRIDCESISSDGDEQLKRELESWVPFCMMVQRSCSFEQYLNFLKPFYVFGNGGIERFDFEKRVENSLRKYPNEFAEEFRKLMRNPSSKSESEKPEKKRKGSPAVESESGKSRKKKRCTPSYEFLPDYDPEAAGVAVDCDSEAVVATPLEPEDSDPRKVLNSSMVCVPKTEYDPGPPKVQTPQERMMNKIEDHLFQLDMTLAWTGSAAENIEEFLKNRVEGMDIREHLTAMNLRCIENLYKRRPHILQYLYENPDMGLPLLLRQLRRKEEELKEKKAERMNKIHGAWQKTEELKQLQSSLSCTVC